MARKCENCNIMEKYKYWNELPATKHSFFKVMSDDFDRQLLIPKKFSECFKEKLCGWCILVGPSGNKWRVRVSSDNSGRVMFSNDGWPSFVRDHGIQLRDFVTFHYTGNSSFKVCIFDTSGCEREESNFAKIGYKSQCKSRKAFHVEENHDNSENEGEAPISENFVEEISKNNRGKKKRSESFDDEDECMFENDKDDETDGESNKSVFNQSTRAKMSQMYYESNRRTVEEAEMQLAIEKAEKHKRKKFPLIPIIMKPTYVYRGFNFTIPKKWAMLHMLRKPHEIELRVAKKSESWIVGCRWTRSQQCQLRKNWPQFVLENNLEEHDVCVFELISKDEVQNKATIAVYIYRVVDDVVPLTVSRRMV